MNNVFLAVALAALSPVVIYGTATISEVKTQDAPQPVGPFSQAIKVHKPQEVLFISGQLPINPATNELEKELVPATELVMSNLAAVLKEAGMDFSNVVKTTILLTNMNDFAVVNKIYESFLQHPYPARATFAVAGLPKGACVEIEMVAAK